MDLILATSTGEEECVLDYDFDIDIGQTNDFQLTLSYGTWDERLAKGKRIYIPGTEFGGIIKGIETSSNTGEILLKGYTWRGYLEHRIIQPPSGSDYYIASGDLNAIIGSLVLIPGFRVQGNPAGASVSYRFERYTDMASGLEKMCESAGYRLDIQYVQTESSGYVLVQAVKGKNYGTSLEYSQDSLIDFSTVDDEMGVNHLICLGQGELRDRTVIHLYADANGNVSQSQTFTGIDEIVATFENSGAELETLIETGTKRLKETANKKTFTPSLKDVDAELYLGDIISGKDYITGVEITKPITGKIVTRQTGVWSFDYRIEGMK